MMECLKVFGLVHLLKQWTNGSRSELKQPDGEETKHLLHVSSTRPAAHRELTLDRKQTSLLLYPNSEPTHEPLPPHPSHQCQRCCMKTLVLFRAEVIGRQAQEQRRLIEHTAHQKKSCWPFIEHGSHMMSGSHKEMETKPA